MPPRYPNLRRNSYAAAMVAPPNVGEIPSEANITSDDARSIGKRAMGGAVWVLLAFFAGRALGIATNLVLARLLSPDDFGLVGFSMIMIGAFTTLQDLGVPASIVYSKRTITTIGGTALTINVVAAGVLFAAAVMISPFLASIGGSDDIAPVAIVLAFGLIVSALGSVQRALLVKELAFRRKFIPDFVPLIASGITSITLAFLGFGAWSLVIGYLVKMGMSTLLLWSLSSIRPWPRFDWPVARELLSYGKHVSMTSVVGFVALNVDYFIVGHTFGTYDLGLYTLAFTISNLSAIAIGQTTQTVMFPAYARIRDNTDALLNTFGNTFTLVSVLSIASAIALFVAGPTFVPLVFGDKWQGIGPPLRVLAIYSCLRTIAMGFSPLYRAVGRPNLEFRLNLVRLVLMIPLMLYLTRYGLVGVPFGFVIMAAVFVPMNGLMMCKTLKLPMRWIWQLSQTHVAGAAVAALVILTWSVALDNGPVGALVEAAVATSAYLLTVVLLERRILRAGQAAVRSVLTRRGRLMKRAT